MNSIDWMNSLATESLERVELHLKECSFSASEAKSNSKLLSLFSTQPTKEKLNQFKELFDQILDELLIAKSLISTNIINERPKAISIDSVIMPILDYIERQSGARKVTISLKCQGENLFWAKPSQVFQLAFLMLIESVLSLKDSDIQHIEFDFENNDDELRFVTLDTRAAQDSSAKDLVVNNDKEESEELKEARARLEKCASLAGCKFTYKARNAHVIKTLVIPKTTTPSN